MNFGAREVRAIVSDLEPPANDSCLRCGCTVKNVSIVVADADQAYEQCGASLITEAWRDISAAVVHQLGTDAALVRRGKEVKTRTFSSGTPPSYFKISTADIGRALLAYCWLSLVTIGGIVYELRGLPIGGVLSGVALSILMAWYAMWAQRRPEQFEKSGFIVSTSSSSIEIRQRRYVDDILGISRSYCRKCVFDYLTLVYKVKLSPASDLEDPETPCVWIDLELWPQQDSCWIAPKNDNRLWLIDQDPGPRPKTNILPWPGIAPRGFGMVVALYSGRLARAQHLALTIPVTLAWILELTLELIILGYPTGLILAALHSCPWSVAIQKARVVTRQWRKFFLPLADPSDMVGEGQGRGGARQPWRRYDTDRDRQAQGQVDWYSEKGQWTHRAGDRDYGQAHRDWDRRSDSRDRDKDRDRDRDRNRRRSPNRDRDRDRDRDRSRRPGTSGRSRSPSEQERELQKMRATLAERDPEYSAFVKDKKDRSEEMKLRRQGEYMASAMKSAFGDRIAKLETQKEPSVKETAERGRRCSPTPVASPPDSQDVMGRAEVGWLQSIIGKKNPLPLKLTWGQAASKLEQAMKNKVVVGQVNKYIKPHFPRKAVPTSKEKRISEVLHIIDGSAV